jgi:hypothetical protein
MKEPDYIQRLLDAIRHMHGCASSYVETVAVKETFKGKTVWEGDVDLFDLTGHATASQCYAWRYRDDEGRWQYVAVLKVGPVDSPLRAVQAYIVSQEENTK